MKALFAILGLIALVLVPGCSGTSSSSQSGYYYARSEGFPSALTPYGNSAEEQCDLWVRTKMPTGDDKGQWVSGCEQRIDGRPLGG